MVGVAGALVKAVWRILTGALGLLAGVGVQVVKHENCVWIGAEVLVAFGLGCLTFEWGHRSGGPAGLKGA